MSPTDTTPGAAATAVRTALSMLLAWFGRLFARTRSLVAAVVTATRDALAGPVRRALVGPVRTGLLGRRPEISLAVALLAPLLAAATAWWVGGLGFETLLRWAEGTWYGTDPNAVVFISVAVLLALAAVSTAVNSGLVPTFALVAGPVFGAAVTRYGTTVERGTGTAVVSLPEAVGVATLFAVAVGLPLALAGFVLGVAARRVVRTLLDGVGRPGAPGHT
jgi:hypothetical protein